MTILTHFANWRYLRNTWLDRLSYGGSLHDAASLLRQPGYHQLGREKKQIQSNFLSKGGQAKNVRKCAHLAFHSRSLAFKF